MINGRVNESKESDFMKMKKILVSMFLLFLVLCLKSNVSNAAETDALNRWDLTKEYTVEQNSIRYHAYLSKDKKESWIFTADLLDKKKMLDIIIPQKIENAPVVMLGFISEFYNIYVPKLKIPGWDDKNMEEWEGYITFFGDIIEPWHGVTLSLIHI